MQPPRRACTASATFSATVSEPNTDEVWKVRPSPQPGPAVRRQPGDVVPGERDPPALGRRSPLTRLNSDVLPAPLGPIRARNSSGATCSVTSSTIGTPPICQDTASTSRAGWPGRRVRRGPAVDGRSGHPAQPFIAPAGGAASAGATVLDQLGGEAGAGAGELGLEHRLQQGVVLGADGQLALDRVEAVAPPAR